jgi:hypothetical protein
MQVVASKITLVLAGCGARSSKNDVAFPYIDVVFFFSAFSWLL